MADELNQTTRQLLSLFGQILEELRRRGVVRSSNNPVADYTELLVTRALSLTLLPNSTRGCDALDSNGMRYEIKGRRVTAHNTSTQLSILRGLDSCHFDYLAGVLYHEDFSVQRACLIPHNVVLNTATYRQRVNGWVLLLRPNLWDHPDVRDITEELRKAQDDQVGD